jgi:hypothetical protein
MRRGWFVVSVVLLACSGSGREGLGGGDSVVDGKAGGTDHRTSAPDLSGQDEVNNPPCIDCDVVMVDSPDISSLDLTSPDLVSDLLAPTDLQQPPPGCCYSTDDCPPNTGGAEVFCVGQNNSPNGMGECLGPPDKSGWCYVDEHCLAGQECHGAAACGCNIDCDPPYLGPGVCVPEGPGCAPIKEAWVTEICNAASVVIWDGEACVETCPGCCGCEPFCELTFLTINDCQSQCGLPADCPEFVGALAEAPYVYQQAPGGCVEQEAMAGPCKTDDHCPGGYPDGTDAGDACVLGNCVNCWHDQQCQGDMQCRAGRCVEPVVGCPPISCNEPGCQVITPSEQPCPVCVCGSTYAISCTSDEACLLFSSHPYGACVNGRCVDCRNDSQCPSLWGPGGATCVQPGMCYDMMPPAFAIYGSWLIGWAGGLNHFSYLRFEPDGTLRRGHYEPPVAWADDMPPMPCYDPAQPSPSPLLGTWEPEVTQSGLLVVRIRLNVPCDGGDGYAGRWAITLDDDGEWATIQDIDSDWQWDARRVPTLACQDDMSLCGNPENFLPW